MSSFLRKRALQLTSMPALHRRILPNCRPMVDGGMRKCSAGACPPQGSGWGSAESTVPIRCTKPQLPLFIPWCAGASRHERFVRKCAYAAFERAVEPLHSAISSFRPPIRHSREEPAPYPDTGRESRGEVRVVAMTLELSHQPMHPIFMPWCAGASRHVRLL